MVSDMACDMVDQMKELRLTSCVACHHFFQCPFFVLPAVFSHQSATQSQEVSYPPQYVEGLYAVQGHLLGEEISARAREADSLTNWLTGIAREKVRVRQFISLYFHFFFPVPCSSNHYLSDKHTPSLSLLFPCLSYVVLERQPSFAPPRELQASVTLS